MFLIKFSISAAFSIFVRILVIVMTPDNLYFLSAYIFKSLGVLSLMRTFFVAKLHTFPCYTARICNFYVTTDKTRQQHDSEKQCQLTRFLHSTLLSGNKEMLPSPRPLRTVRATFTAHGSGSVKSLPV